MKRSKDFITKFFVILTIATTTLLSSCTQDTDFTVDDDESTDELDTASVTEWIDENLEKYYLYNEEYKSMTRDLDQEYDAFLDNTLMSMTTNVLDKKYYETYYQLPYYDYLLYSYILRSDSTTKSRAIMDSREDVSFGFVATELVMTSSRDYAIAIHGVYDDSPADECGMSRGTIITSVDGSSITWNNYYNLLLQLCYPSDGDQVTVTTFDEAEYTLTATTTEVNPILHYEVIEPNIGYLVYSLFDSNFDSDLESVIAEFNTAGVSDLILDLRLNPGGYVSSSNLLSSMIAGSYASNKIYMYYLFNDDLTQNFSTTSLEFGLPYDSTNKAFSANFYTTSTTLSTLSSPRIYCLVSSLTASASELLINSLRGIDFEVILIGEKSEGKNVGMITLNTTIGDYEYDLLPITFENRNAKMEGGYEDGMEVDYEVNDITYFTDFGADEAMVAKALELITGETRSTTRSSLTSAELTKTAGQKAHHKRGGSLIELQE